MSPRVRMLRAGEEEQLLDLLDGWPLEEGVSGREFFRRYLEQDPTYAPENVFVAELGGRFVSCVQIFPRRIRAQGRDSVIELTVGGIGSVFTERSQRKLGLAGALLEEATRTMEERGLVLSGLLAARVAWYQKHGWYEIAPHQWRARSGGPMEDPVEDPNVAVLSGADVAADSSLSSRLRTIGDAYASSRVGILVRDGEAWQASFSLAGNPEEQFYLSEGKAYVKAYLRTTELYGDLQVLEWGRTEDGADQLVELFLALLRRHPSVLLAWAKDEPVFRRLREAGVSVEKERHASWMFRVLDRTALLKLLGSEATDLDDRQLVERVLPKQEFEFFMSDRF